MPAEVPLFADAAELADALADEILAAYAAAGDRPFLGEIVSQHRRAWSD